MSYKIEMVKELANEIKASGFRVFIAKSGTYGFYTDANGTRVVSFQAGLSGMTFSGNYKTTNPHSTGTGWQLENNTFKDMFNQIAPNWAVRGAEWNYTTLEQHLATYQKSSVYSEIF